MKWQDVILEQLLKQDPVVMGMLGKQAIRKEKYRSLTYVLKADESDKKIFYNLLTHEIIAANVSELESPVVKQYFIENWYLVPEDYDDKLLVDECRAVLNLMDSWPKKIHVFHIFTTLDCNARCFYCFEKRMAGSHMTLETGARVIEYMQEQAEGVPIKIVWFGGEPLFNYPVIDFISSGLIEKGLEFESEMITNGLLFDSGLIEKAKIIWNVKEIQITLDGTESVYNKIKSYVTEVINPFERVLQNIKSLLRANIRVCIRLNIGLHNYVNMQDLVDYLCEVFKGETNLKIYTSPMIEIIKYSDENRVLIYDTLDELNRKLDKHFRYKKKIEFANGLTNSSCMASGREAVTILPDGKIGICENATTNSLVGDIYTKELDTQKREEFGRRFYREDKCRPCPLYPNCYIVDGCPNKDSREGCNPIKVKRVIREIKEKMKNRYRIAVSGSEEGYVYKIGKAKEELSEAEI